MGDDLLFVYATLRGDTGGDMHHTLARVADFVGTATFRGRLYKVRHYAGAAPSDDPKDRVHGEVYRLRDPQKILAVLDEYEGCEPSSADGEFERHETNVALDSGESVRAWIYVYRKPTLGLERIVAGDFLRASE